MAFSMIENFLSIVLSVLSYLFSVMVGFMMPWLIITFDKNGRIRDTDGRFVSFWRGLIFVVGAVLSSLLVEFASSVLQSILYQNIQFLPAITSGMSLILIVWFYHSFSYKTTHHWKALAFLALVVFVNIMLVYRVKQALVCNSQKSPSLSLQRKPHNRNRTINS